MNLDINNKRNSGFSLFESLIKEKKRLVEEKLILNKKDKHKYPIKDTPFEIPANWCWCLSF